MTTSAQTYITRKEFGFAEDNFVHVQLRRQLRKGVCEDGLVNRQATVSARNIIVRADR